MMRVRILLSIVLLSLGLSTGCENDTGTFPGNFPPLTYLSIQGADLDTTDYRKILNWWGSDRDGVIAGYLIRWDGMWEPAPGTEQVYNGEAYSFTTATEDTFDVPIAGEYAERTFTVRAIDDQGLIDANGASQLFPLKNGTPWLLWKSDVPRPTSSLPAVAFGWSPRDFDGSETVKRFRVWLDGDSANARTVRDTIFALFPEDFGEKIGMERTLFVHGIDDAETPTNTLSHTWFVERPQGDWLLIDQITGPGASTWDRPFYEAALDSVTGGSIHTIDLVDGPDFVIEEEIEPLFTLFRGVIWVTGPYNESNDLKMVRNLRTAAKGIAAYVEKGGRFILSGQSLIGFRGGLTTEFADTVLGIPSYYDIRIEPEGTRVTDLPLARDEVIYFRSGDQIDSLIVRGSATRIDYFVEPISPGTGRYYVPPGALEEMSGSIPRPQQDDVPAYFGVISDYGSGRICMLTISYARLFPRRSADDPQWESSIREGVTLFREVLSP